MARNTIKVELKGLKEAIKQVKGYRDKVVSAVDDELAAGAVLVMNRAKLNAPVDEGFLRNSIHTDVTKTLAKYVQVSVFYAVYMEFGTGSNTKIPAGYEQFAAQFRGKRDYGSSAQTFFLQLVQWVLRKGLTARYSVKTRKRQRINKGEADAAYQIAYLIMRKIFKYGVKPQPFLIPAYQASEAEIIKNVGSAIKAIK